VTNGLAYYLQNAATEVAKRLYIRGLCLSEAASFSRKPLIK